MTTTSGKNLVIKRFLEGFLKGLTIVEVNDVNYTVGTPINAYGGDVYIIDHQVALEALTENDVAEALRHTTFPRLADVITFVENLGLTCREASPAEVMTELGGRALVLRLVETGDLLKVGAIITL